MRIQAKKAKKSDDSTVPGRKGGIGFINAYFDTTVNSRSYCLCNTSSLQVFGLPCSKPDGETSQK